MGYNQSIDSSYMFMPSYNFGMYGLSSPAAYNYCAYTNPSIYSGGFNPMFGYNNYMTPTLPFTFNGLSSTTSNKTVPTLAGTDLSTISHKGASAEAAATTSDLPVEEPEKKEGRSVWGKIGIGLLVTAVVVGLGLGADHLWNGGKCRKAIGDWFKNIGKAKPEGEPKPKTETPNAETSKPEGPKNDTEGRNPNSPAITNTIANDVANNKNNLLMENLEKHSKEPMKSYNSLEEGITDYRAVLANIEYEASRDAEKLLNSLVKHNYGKEKSYIEITTRTKFKDYNSRVVDVENSILHKTRILPEGIRRKVDFSGSYLITTLPDGKKLVGISIPSGRVDKFNRPIRTKISIISKDNEFTPMQKDLIEVISTWKNTEAIKDSSGSNILSLGILSSTKQTQRNAYDVNQEILMSSIKTAREQVDGKIDNAFVQNALNLRIGEELGQSISG